MIFIETQKYYYVLDSKFIFSFSNGHIHNVVLTLPNVLQMNVEINHVDSTLFNVINSNVDVHNVASTLIWRCTMSWRHINLKTTSKQRWNVFLFEFTGTFLYQSEFNFLFPTYCISVFGPQLYLQKRAIASVWYVPKPSIFSHTEAATVDVLWKRVFIEISQDSQENTSASSFLIKLQVSGLHFY